MVQPAAVLNPSLARWLLNISGGTLAYKEYDRLGEQARFVREHIQPLFGGSDERPHERIVRVVGGHRERSVEYPVYQVCVPGLEVRFAGHSHKWVVSVHSDRPVLGDRLFRSELINIETQVEADEAYGITQDWLFWPYALGDKWRFTGTLDGDFNLHAFFYILTTLLDARGSLGVSSID